MSSAGSSISVALDPYWWCGTSTVHLGRCGAPCNIHPNNINSLKSMYSWEKPYIYHHHFESKYKYQHTFLQLSLTNCTGRMMYVLT